MPSRRFPPSQQELTSSRFRLLPWCDRADWKRRSESKPVRRSERDPLGASFYGLLGSFYCVRSSMNDSAFSSLSAEHYRLKPAHDALVCEFRRGECNKSIPSG